MLGGWVGEEVVDLSGYVPFETADDLSAGFAFRSAFFHIGNGALVSCSADGGDPPQSLVGLAVASSVEAVADDTSRGRLDRAHAAQRSEGRFGGHSFGVVTAAISSAAAMSGPIPGVANSAGLACAQRRLISVSSSRISAVRIW